MPNNIAAFSNKTESFHVKLLVFEIFLFTRSDICTDKNLKKQIIFRVHKFLKYKIFGENAITVM